MKKISVIVDVKDGVVVGDKKLIKDIISSYDGKRLKMTFEVARKTRTNQQNKYYWGVVVPIWKNIIKVEWGTILTTDETHEFLKNQYNFKEIVNHETGEIVKIPKQTKKNNTIEMIDFIERCRQGALLMFSVDIPLPNEYEIDLQ